MRGSPTLALEQIYDYQTATFNPDRFEVITTNDNELSPAVFTIEGSVDGADWTELFNSSATPVAILEGTENAYRFDGTSLNNDPADFDVEILIGPNPVTKGTFTVLTDLTNPRFNLYDYAGKAIMLNQMFLSGQEIDASMLSVGTYIIQVYNTEKTYTKLLSVKK